MSAYTESEAAEWHEWIQGNCGPFQHHHEGLQHCVNWTHTEQSTLGSLPMVWCLPITSISRFFELAVPFWVWKVAVRWKLCLCYSCVQLGKETWWRKITAAAMWQRSSFSMGLTASILTPFATTTLTGGSVEPTGQLMGKVCYCSNRRLEFCLLFSSSSVSFLDVCLFVCLMLYVCLKSLCHMEPWHSSNCTL